MNKILRRTIGAVTTAAMCTLLLVGCGSLQLPFKESFKTAIPAALLASDLGITEASAGTDVDGLSVSLDVYAVFDRSTVTADELHRMLAIIVNNNDLSNPYGLSIIAVDGSLPDMPYIPLDVVGEELGFAQSELSDDSLEARWGTVIAYLESTRE